MRVLVIAASPGDAEFACGGTLARVTRDGGATAICTIANGNSAGVDVPPRDLADTRRAEAEEAADILGAELYWLNHSDFAVADDSVTRVKVADVLRAFQADVVLAPAALGPSRDARAAGVLALGAAELAAAPNARSHHPALDAAPHVIAYAAWVGRRSRAHRIRGRNRDAGAETTGTGGARDAGRVAPPARRHRHRSSRGIGCGVSRASGRRGRRRGLPVGSGRRSGADATALALTAGHGDIGRAT